MQTIQTLPVAASLDRLNCQLPLAQRQAALPPGLQALHRAILLSLFETGAMPPPDARMAELRALDLVVYSRTSALPVGAYPMTTEPTPHLLKLEGRSVYAMCALDALAVAAMFGGEVEIVSRCRMTGEPVRIQQDGERIVSANPPGVCVGVRWQLPTGGDAAHSMCMEMVFLRDAAAAQTWHNGDTARHSIFSLADAVDFAARFFRPLLGAE